MAKLFSYRHHSLHTQLAGLALQSPVGLAAGFDYNADLMRITASLGFGFQTVGTVTLGAYQGNPRPMLGRLPKSRSLLVNKGFKSPGMQAILHKLGHKTFPIPIGLSIGATNRRYENFGEMVEEVAQAFALARSAEHIAYFELNISCPNLINITNFPERVDTPSGLRALLTRLSAEGVARPLFVKMPLEKTPEETLALCQVMVQFAWVSGVILSNLAKNRSNPAFDPAEILRAGTGNFSGKPTEKQSNELISAVYKEYGGRLVIVGCGGIFSGVDAYEKIRRGASAVQLITGMVYMGPGQICAINQELAKLLARDGFTSVVDAVGTAPGGSGA